MMSTRLFRASLVGVCLAVVSAVVGWTAMGKTPLAASGAVFLAAIALALTVIVVMVWRGAPPQTIAEVLYDTDRTS